MDEVFPWSRLPFAEAIAYFAQKENVDTESWADVQGTANDAAFVVAGAKGALLQDLRNAVEQAIVAGTTLEEFRQQFDQIVQARGWSYTGDRDWRTNVIFQTNLRTSYAAGRFEQLQAVKDTRPYWQWRHGNSRDPRPLHLALDRRVFSNEELFWQGLFPPCGYGCKCTVYALSDRTVATEGLTVESAPEVGGTFDGYPVQPDPGWGGGHGRSTPESRAQLLEELTKGLHPTLAQQVAQEAQQYG